MNKVKSYRLAIVGRKLSLPGMCLWLIGCGSGGSVLSVPGVAPQIVTEPQSITVPIGLQAEFSVSASGADLSYSWTKNGSVISGASGRTLTTSAVVLSDTGSVFAVTVSNASGSVTSVMAELTAGARAPKIGDLRFQNVDAAYVIGGVGGGVHTTLLANNPTTYFDAVGSPLEIGSGLCSSAPAVGCEWFYQAQSPSAGATAPIAAYTSGLESSLQSDLFTLSPPNTVITSLDVEDSNNQYGLLAQSVSGYAGDMIQHVGSLTTLQAAASLEGSEGRVITAISFAAGQPYYLSYGWQGDTTDTYDVSVVVTNLASITTAATQLASQGYIITAFGGNGTDGMVLIGYRLTGDTMPRQLLYAQYGGSVPDTSGNLVLISEQGYALVGYTFDANTGVTTWLGER